MAKRPHTAPKAVQEESEPFFERNSRPLLAAVLLLALGLRITALIDLSRSIYVDFLLWDERIYHELALRILNGTSAAGVIDEFAPLFAYLMAGIYRIFSPDTFHIRFLNILIGVLVCWAVCGIGTRLGGRPIGLLACLAAALYQPLIFYSIVPLKDILAVLLFALTALLLIDALEKKGGLLPAGLTGLALGLLINVRPNAMILVPLLFLMILWERIRNRAPLRGIAALLCLYLFGFCIAIAPFVIRNVIASGQFALTTSQSGHNLYLGNNLRNPDPYYRPVPFATSSPFEQGIQFTIEASRRAGRVLDSREASDYWTREVFRMALAEPRAFAAKLFRKALVLINRFEACDHYDIGFVSNFVPFFRFPFPGFAVIFPLGMAALALRLFRDRRARALGLILAAYGATLVIFFTNARYRLPMVAVLIPFAAMGLADLVETFRRRRFRQAALWGALLAAFAAVEFLPIRATDDLTAYVNTHAIILDSRGFENEAILYWQRSSQMDRPFSAFANLSLAQKAIRKGRTREGQGYLDRIPDDSFTAAEKQELMGDLLAGEKRLDEASRAYERSLDINSGQRRALVKLIRIERLRDPRKAAVEEARLKTLEEFYGKKGGAP
jgi:4-amino-4-deoxy-L-arabinose transferase-like glycosyltransferase